MTSWLNTAIAGHWTFELGELTIQPRDAGWQLGVPGDQERVCGASQSSELRQFVMSEDSGRYRPLTGARSLPTGWTTHVPDGSALREAIDAIYPLATAHIAQEAAGELRIVTLDEVLVRQSGRYESAAKLSSEGRQAATEVVCGECVRTPLWVVECPAKAGDTTFEGEERRPPEIPCPEPCSIIVSFCREAASWESNPPGQAAPDPETGFAAFDEPGNELREAWLARRNPSPNTLPKEEERHGIPADSRH